MVTAYLGGVDVAPFQKLFGVVMDGNLRVHWLEMMELQALPNAGTIDMVGDL